MSFTTDCLSRAGWLVARYSLESGFMLPCGQCWWKLLSQAAKPEQPLVQHICSGPARCRQSDCATTNNNQPHLCCTLPALLTAPFQHVSPPVSPRVSSFRTQPCCGLTCSTHPLTRSIAPQRDADAADTSSQLHLKGKPRGMETSPPSNFSSPQQRHLK